MNNDNHHYKYHNKIPYNYNQNSIVKIIRLSIAPVLVVIALLFPLPLFAASLCPAAINIPQLTIDTIRDPAVPVIDKWQVFWDGVPISDGQLALLSRRDPLIEMTRAEMKGRGMNVYMSLGAVATGALMASIGWILYGQQSVSQNVSLPLAATGLVTSMGGVFAIARNIQSPLEPHLAPTPKHRFTREQTRRLVAAINTRFFSRICKATREVKRTVSVASKNAVELPLEEQHLDDSLSDTPKVLSDYESLGLH